MLLSTNPVCERQKVSWLTLHQVKWTKMQSMQRNSRVSSSSSQQNAHAGGCVRSDAQSTFTQESSFLTRAEIRSSGHRWALAEDPSGCNGFFRSRHWWDIYASPHSSSIQTRSLVTKITTLMHCILQHAMGKIHKKRSCVESWVLLL